MVVTIDGPVASGKSTAARNLARALGFDHLDTGAVYRAVTLLARRREVDAADAGAVHAMLADADVRIDGEKTLLAGEDVSDEIRLPEISSAVRPFAENAEVRDFVGERARRYAGGRDIVAEGRDMGTVVFPDARVKVFLTASDDERARRRWEELEKRGTPQPLDRVLADLKARDEADTHRKVAPLRKADDAVAVDSTGWTQEETLRRLIQVVKGRLGV